MSPKDFNYGKAEADLYDVGCDDSEEIYSYKSKKSRDSFLREHGLNPDKYEIRQPEPKKQDNCFLTTACVTARNLPDDCIELETLRAYRDGYLRNRAGGAEDIEYYYNVAPSIVSRINEQENAEEIWNSLYEKLIVPCVRMIGDGKMEETYRLYKNTVVKLREEYLL